MTVGVPVSSLKPPSYVSGLYQKNIQTLTTEIKSNHVRSISIKRDVTQTENRRRFLDTNRVQRSNSVSLDASKEVSSQVAKNVADPNTRSRRMSGTGMTTPRLNRTIEENPKNIVDIQRKDTALSRRRSVDPSSLSRAKVTASGAAKEVPQTSENGSSNRSRRFSTSGTTTSQLNKSVDKSITTEEKTPKKNSLLSRRRTIDPSSLSREQGNLHEDQEKMRALAVIAEKRKKKKEEDEQKKKEEEGKALSYNEKFKNFKKKARTIRNANTELAERIANLQSEMMEINLRLSQLTTERVVHMIETVLNA